MAYATVRIDDDDLLSANFENRVSQYISPVNADYVASFPVGYQCFFIQKGDEYFLSEAIHLHYPKIALGLAHIGYYDNELKSFRNRNCNIFQTGNHTTVDERHKMIFDTTPSMYVRVSHELQDTQAVGFKKRLSNSRQIELNRLLANFPQLFRLNG